MSKNNKKQMKIMSRIRLQAGTSLIEILVSLVVMSTGLLGVLGMQTLTLKQSSENFSYNQANFLAQDLFDRMTANVDQIIKDGSLYELTFKDSQTQKTVQTFCNKENCDAKNIAAWDLYEWQTNLLNSEYLPKGQAKIDVNLDASGKFSYVQLTVRFLHNHGGDSISITNATDAENSYEQFIFERQI